MRHRKKVNHLGRQAAHRQAMLSNMAASLILHKRIKTTLQKAKALRVYVEPLINRSKDNTTHSRRIVFGYLQNKEAVTELFRDIADKVADRPGGYTRILKIENRQGDNAEMCYIELVDYNENMLKTTTETKKSTTRRSKKSSGKSTTDAHKPEPKTEKPVDVGANHDLPEEPVVETVEEPAVEEPVVEEPVVEADNNPSVAEEPVEEAVEEPVVETVEEPVVETDNNPSVTEEPVAETSAEAPPAPETPEEA